MLLNDGHGTFTDLGPARIWRLFITSLVAGDFNGDGAIDLAAANIYDGSYSPIHNVTLYLGDGSGVFTPAVTYENGRQAGRAGHGGFQQRQPCGPCRRGFRHLGPDGAAGDRHGGASSPRWWRPAPGSPRRCWQN